MKAGQRTFRCFTPCFARRIKVSSVAGFSQGSLPRRDWKVVMTFSSGMSRVFIKAFVVSKHWWR